MLCHCFTKAQHVEPVKDSFTLRSRPTYDINGNYYSYEKKYDHLPTQQDSIDFRDEKNEAFKPLIDSVEREVAKEQKRIEEMNREYYANHKQKQYAPLYPREGKHLFSLHWISWKKFGSVNIKKINTKKYSIKGSQKDDKGNYVTIDGFLIPVTKGKLSFIGEIVTRTSGNNNGVACTKNGTYTFLSKPGNKYWRLQEMKNCEGGSLVDYVDIFF
jgi:hypothetical protein